MNALPTDLLNIIYNYQHQITFYPVMDELVDKIIEYCPPEGMAAMWGWRRPGDEVYHQELSKSRNGRSWCRDIGWTNYPSIFDCDVRYECEDCGKINSKRNTPRNEYTYECDWCEKYYCGCRGEPLECCESESED